MWVKPQSSQRVMKMRRQSRKLLSGSCQLPVANFKARSLHSSRQDHSIYSAMSTKSQKYTTRYTVSLIICKDYVYVTSESFKIVSPELEANMPSTISITCLIERSWHPVEYNFPQISCIFMLTASGQFSLFMWKYYVRDCTVADVQRH